MLANTPARYQCILLCVLTLTIFVVSLSLGSVSLSLNDFLDKTNATHHQILMTLRLPRTIAAFTTGGLLALAGLLLQVLLRNPLADPYILGVSSGASLMNIIGLIMGIPLFWLTPVAFLGAMLSMILVFGLSYQRGAWSGSRLLLTGVMVASLWGAGTSFILNFSSDQHLRESFNWFMGDLSHTHLPHVSLCMLLLGLFIGMQYARRLNMMTLGELQARTLGVDTRKVSFILYFLSAMLTACAVVIAGPIAFVGLIVPHSLRLIGMHDHRLLLPNTVLLGGAFLMLADLLSRTLLAPVQIPVGIITALIGAPVFLFLLSREGSCH